MPTIALRKPPAERLPSASTPMSTTPETLESLISSTIARHPHLRHRRVHFEAHSGHVVLRGVVGSYYQKQMAQEAIRRLQGVAQVENCLEVDWSQTPC